MNRSRTYAYDRGGLFARPTLQFYVMPPNGEISVRSGRALLDTGSTHCSIPRKTLSELELEPVHDVDAYDVVFAVPEHFSARLRVLATHADEPLIGRDVMDTWRVTFDGPEKEIKVEPVF